jgi:hypothetical protein
MPNQPDVRSTSHDRHDPLLVAALAAGDLAGTDRDHATDLIESCPDCATLHDDLVAIARATASVPPPFAVRPRDYRLSLKDAARLRPAGWRRFAGVLAGPRLAFTKPLGIGLATIGLAGLLLANVNLSLGLGSSAAAPAPPVPAAAGASSGSVQTVDGNNYDAATGEVRAPYGSAAVPAASAPAASAGLQAFGPASSGSAAPTTLADRLGAAGSASSAGPKGGVPATAGSEAVGVPSGQNFESVPTPAADLRNLVFIAAVLLGLALLVVRRVARGFTAL